MQITDEDVHQSSIGITCREEAVEPVQEVLPRSWGNCRVYCIDGKNQQPRITIGPEIRKPICMAVGVVVLWVAVGVIASDRPLWALIPMHICSSVQLVSWLATLLLNPGIIRYGLSIRTPAAGSLRTMRCPICDITVDNDIFHCKECGVCCDGYDHHCEWLGKCVGRYNLLWFNIFIRAALVGFGIDIVCLITPP